MSLSFWSLCFSLSAYSVFVLHCLLQNGQIEQAMDHLKAQDTTVQHEALRMLMCQHDVSSAEIKELRRCVCLPTVEMQNYQLRWLRTHRQQL